MVLGRSAGLSEDKLAHLGDDPVPDGIYAREEAAIVRYAQALTRLDPIDDALYSELTAHFDARQIIELCFTIGLANMINRFHATFHTDVDEMTQQTVGAACPLPLPAQPRHV